jgi:type VI secretion system secreted protein Hcp
MANDMFMKFSNKIDGESIVVGHLKEIEISSWSWGMAQQGTMHTGTGGGAGKVEVHDLTFTHFIDSASNTLMQKCCDGTHIDTADLTVRKAGGAAAVEYFKVHLMQCIVSSVSVGGSSGEDRLSESVTLNFAKFKVEYTPQDAKGGGGASSPVMWNIPANSPKL